MTSYEFSHREGYTADGEAMALAERTEQERTEQETAEYIKRSHRRLTSKELTQAIRRSARRHGYYASTVRTCSRLLYRAIAEWWQWKETTP